MLRRYGPWGRASGISSSGGQLGEIPPFGRPTPAGSLHGVEPGRRLHATPLRALGVLPASCGAGPRCTAPALSGNGEEVVSRCGSGVGFVIGFCVACPYLRILTPPVPTTVQQPQRLEMRRPANVVGDRARSRTFRLVCAHALPLTWGFPGFPTSPIRRRELDPGPGPRSLGGPNLVMTAPALATRTPATRGRTTPMKPPTPVSDCPSGGPLP